MKILVSLLCALLVPASALAQVCGDAAIEPPEQCDDANAVAGDGCSDTCQIETAFY